MERHGHQVSIRASRGEGRPEVQLSERAVVVDADDVADPVVVQVELATLDVDVDRHQRAPSARASTTPSDTRPVPRGTQAGCRGHAGGAQAAVRGVDVDHRLGPRRQVHVVARCGQVGRPEVRRRDLARSVERDPQPRRAPSCNSSQRTSAWPPFSCGRTYGTYCSPTLEPQRPTAPPRHRSGYVSCGPRPNHSKRSRPGTTSSTVPTWRDRPARRGSTPPRRGLRHLPGRSAAARAGSRCRRRCGSHPERSSTHRPARSS